MSKGLWVSAALLAGLAGLAGNATAKRPEPIRIDYPAEGSIFPPEITAPAFLWRDPVEAATAWVIEVAFEDGSAGIRVKSRGERLRTGEIDPRCIANTNELPKLTPQQAAMRTWTPDAATWVAIKKHSVLRPARVTISGLPDEHSGHVLSSGRVSIQTSHDPVGAPIFYRDVPLMPSELEKGVIKPLAAGAVPLIAWRLRYVAEPRSRLVMEGLYTCVNCHSFSRDGKTLGMDLDGPNNDKGLYAIASVKPQMSIRNEDVISWNSFKKDAGAGQRVGFMSQVSPDGKYVVTTIDAPGSPRTGSASSNFYVANFKDYRFLQVFYPTRGILAWYNRETGHLRPLPGADDPSYVQTDGVWSPDGKYVVFARAKAQDPYPKGRALAEFANDHSETPIQYDLYRIPFNEGRGGRATLIAGASRNGMSNSFPKVSPDGRWIVFVQCRNGQLMRPDSQLYIVPAEGGQARRMRANTPLMNSWHSFSPNGRWLVFSSKSRSPYTQMYLTHLDDGGNDSPAILVENTTAANRAVNIPEFVNVPPEGIVKIDVPAVEFYRLVDRAMELARKGEDEAAIAEWRKALELSPEDARAHNDLGVVLTRTGKIEEAIVHFRKALIVSPEYSAVHNNLAVALAKAGRVGEAIGHYREALQANPGSAEAHNGLGVTLVWEGKLDEAISHFEKALAVSPGSAEFHHNLAVALAKSKRLDAAIGHYRKALEIDPGYIEAQNNLGVALARAGKFSEAIPHFQKVLEANPNSCEAHRNLGEAYSHLPGKIPEALEHWRKALTLAVTQNDGRLAESLKARIGLYEAKLP